MQAFQFRREHDLFYNYHLPVSTSRWLELRLEDLAFAAEIHDSSEYKFLQQHLAYQPSFLADNVWLYYLLLEQLRQERSVLCLDVGETGGLYEYFPLSFAARWEYFLHYELLSEAAERSYWHFAELGWCRAKSEICVDYEARDVEWETARRSPVFQLNYQTELLQSLNMLDPGLFAARNYIFCPEDRLAHWQESLQSSQEPELEALLDSDTLMLILNFGEPTEEGFGDYILIKSASDCDAQVQQLSQQLEDAGQRYEAALSQISVNGSFQDYFHCLRACFHLPVWTPPQDKK